MKLLLLTGSYLLFTCVLINAQSLTPTVISAQGDYFTSGNGSISWTLGEIMTETYSPSNMLTQGFQQPKDTNLSTRINSSISNNTQYCVYPSPCQSNMHIVSLANSRIAIFNLLGQEKLSSNVITGNNIIDLSNLTDGIYLIVITNLSNQKQSTFKISKLN